MGSLYCCESRCGSNRDESIAVNFSHPAYSSSSSICIDNDYRTHIIKAYVHHIKMILHARYKNNEYEIFVRIPIVINRIIEQYYLHYQVYGVNIKHNQVQQLPELENLVYDTKKVFLALDKLYIKYFTNAMRAFIYQLSNDGEHVKHSHQQYLVETYCFRDFMHINEIDCICNSLYTEYRKIIQLKNGTIYTQYSKNANGWNKLYQFKSKRINVCQIDCGFAHSLFLSMNGQVFSQGNNQQGECGIIKTKNGVRINDTYIKNPTLIETFVDNGINIASISCGHSHNVCLDNQNHNVWMFGRNKVWQCCAESNTDYIDHQNGLFDGWSSYRTEIYLPHLNRSFQDTNIIKAKCGNDFTVLLSEKGFLYGLGNVNGAMNLEIRGVSLISKKNNIIDFEVATDYIVYIDDKQRIYSFECKQSWWYGWNRNRTLTQDWHGSKAQNWRHDRFQNICQPSCIDKILVGRDGFVLFIN